MDCETYRVRDLSSSLVKAKHSLMPTSVFAVYVAMQNLSLLFNHRCCLHRKHLPMSRIKIASSANFSWWRGRSISANNNNNLLARVCRLFTLSPSLLNQAEVRFNCAIFNDDRLWTSVKRCCGLILLLLLLAGWCDGVIN